MGEGDVQRPLGLARIPAFAGSDLIQEPPNENLPAVSIGNLEKHIACEGETVSPQHESLNIGRVQFTHLALPTPVLANSWFPTASLSRCEAARQFPGDREWVAALCATFLRSRQRISAARPGSRLGFFPVSYTHLRAHETDSY